MGSLVNKGASSVQSPASLRRTSNPVSPLAANIPCNEKGTDYKTLANQTLATLMSEVVKFDKKEVDTSITLDNWRSITKKSDVELYFKIDKFTKQRILLSVTTVACDIYDALELIKDIKSRKGFELLLKDNYELESFDENTTFNYCTLKSKACLINYNIDICYLSTHREINSTHVVGFTSILDHPNAPSTADVKRSWLYYSGYVLEPIVGDNNKINIYFILHVDLRIHDLPDALKNKLLEKHAFSILQLKQALEVKEPIETYTLSRFKLNETLQAIESKAFVRESGIDLSLDLDVMVPDKQYNETEIKEIPNLFMWSLPGADDPENNNISKYVTLGNSATASLFREYINLLEALRFSEISPEKFNWKVVESQNGVWILEKTGSTIQCMAGIINIRATEKEIADFVKDPRNRFTFDSTLHKTYVVDEINEDLNIIYSQHKAKHCFIGHGRDFLYFQYDRKEGDKRILASASCNHPKCPVDNEIVRGTMYESGFIIEPLPESELCSVTYIVKMELGAGIPDSLARWIKRKQPKILIGIKRFFEK